MEQNQNYETQPYFETPADFQYKIINPSANEIFTNFKEINKDIVTGNLSSRDINLLLYADSIIGVCEVATPYLDSFSENMARDMMMIANVSKGKNGFLLKRFTEHHFIKTDRFSKIKNENNNIGD